MERLLVSSAWRLSSKRKHVYRYRAGSTLFVILIPCHVCVVAKGGTIWVFSVEVEDTRSNLFSFI